MNALEEQLAALCDERGWDYGIRLSVAHECAWSAEVRVTRQPNIRTGPDRSEVWYAGGGNTPTEVMNRVLRVVLRETA